MEDVVADDMSTYKPVVGDLGLEHQICVTPVLRLCYAYKEERGVAVAKGERLARLEVAPADAA